MHFRRSLRLPATLLLLGAVPVICPLHAARAQLSAGGGAQGGGGSSDERDAADAQQQAQAKADAKAAAPPPAIPGAVTDEATATSGHVSADMEPTAALFDSINRGDMTSAKEALGRGADLNGRNVLGQSPLDMAIDLNRNDITFLLLSMRNGEGGAPAASIATASADAQPAAARGARGRTSGRSARFAAAASHGASAPQRYAADGGTPKPDIGFLGFGGS